MKITVSHRFDATVERVLAMLQDEHFLARRASAAGAAGSDVLVDRDEDGGFTAVIRRTVPTASIPAEWRAFVGSQLTVRYTEVWGPYVPGEDVEGTFAVETQGAPGHARGALVLQADGDATRFGMSGDVTAQVPIVGPVVEKAIAASVENALPQELAAADAWLAEHREG